MHLSLSHAKVLGDQTFLQILWLDCIAQVNRGFIWPSSSVSHVIVMWVYYLACLRRASSGHHQHVHPKSVVLITGSAQGAGPGIALCLASMSLPNILIGIESLRRKFEMQSPFLLASLRRTDTSMVVSAVERTYEVIWCTSAGFMNATGLILC